MAGLHFYAAPGPIGATVRPGPRGNPEVRAAMEATVRLPGETTVMLAENSVGNNRLARSQLVAHDHHASVMLKQHHRALTGRIFGNTPAPGDGQFGPRSSSRGGASRRSASSPLLAAGSVTAAPLMGSRMSPSPLVTSRSDASNL
mmetsp:Transcript_84793/g.133955  ORF Transcript_84793/g.133955 Transcript_84793/m.133955 type:complete len:145 (+) Transcript_84793:75-509(+)